MSSRDLENLYEQFGITHYHANGFLGQGVSILVVDTGLDRSAANNVHGLAVASLITGDAEAGIRGIAPRATVHVADVRDPSSIPIATVIEAMRSGIAKGVDLMCISLGTSDPWGPMQDVVSAATQAGILLFAAAGNSGERGYEFPAACEEAISVGSMNSARQPSPFNTRNDAVVVFAPGEKLRLPTGPQGRLEEFTGTSFATPFAVGVAALVLSKERIANGHKSFRMKRRAMVDRLRDPDHFGLNCTDHTYVMDKTCTDFAQAPSVALSGSSHTSSIRRVQVGFLVLALLLGFAMLSMVRQNK
jgi:subtilisin family serine protease